MPNQNDQILDASVRRQTYVVRLGAGQGRQSNEIIDKTTIDLKTLIALALLSLTSEPTKANQAILAKLKRDVEKLRTPAFIEARDDQKEDMVDLAENEDDWIKRTMLAILGLSMIGLTRLQVERIVELTPFAGKTIDQWWKSASDSDVNRIMTTVTKGVYDELPAKTIVDSVIGTKTTAGALKTTKNDINALSKTITTGVSNAASETVAKKADAIDRVMWVSILDGKTTVICRDLAGQIWLITQPRVSPPAHRNCRSRLTYLIVGVAPPGDLTFNDWATKQDDDFLRESMPKWQYKEYKKGKPISAFMANDLEPLTMKEFKAKQ